MLVAVPSHTPGGLDAAVAEHFGHCDAFTLVSVEDGEVGEVTVLENAGHEQGGCMAPVTFLKKHKVEALLSGGMGMRPLAGFQQVGITVYFSEGAATVAKAVELFAAGKCKEFGEAQTCGGGGGECGGDHHHHHHHEPVVREPIEGKADVRADRAVTFEFELKDTDGKMLDASSNGGPMSYLHGHDNIAPGLEKGLAGLEKGDKKVVNVSAKEGFGERDEAKIVEVPRQKLPPEAQVGGMIMAQDPTGRTMGLTVLELSDEIARLDANHPLAGKDLVFDVTIVAVEKALPEEITAGRLRG